VRAEALVAARESLRLTNNQYKAGLIAYLGVVTVQTTALSNERSVLTLLQSRLVASVQLIAALGGGWNAESGLAAKD
jgi:outer membrane protein TolC